MKLELNGPALERLIGGDTEVELHLRKQIVHNFAKKHLKVVAEQEAYRAALEEAKQHANAVAKEHFGIDNLASTHLRPLIEDRLKKSLAILSKKRLITL